VNSRNRRISRTRPSTSGPLRRLACCWRRHPASISSNNAGPGENGASPSAVTSASPPRRSPTQPPGSHTRCIIWLPSATESGATSWHLLQPAAGNACSAGVSRACHAAQAGQAGSSSPYGFAITPSGECCIRCNSAYLKVVCEGLPELVRVDVGVVARLIGPALQHLIQTRARHRSPVAGA